MCGSEVGCSVEWLECVQARVCVLCVLCIWGVRVCRHVCVRCVCCIWGVRVCMCVCEV